MSKKMIFNASLNFQKMVHDKYYHSNPKSDQYIHLWAAESQKRLMEGQK